MTKTIGGPWGPTELGAHMNYLELLASLLALQAFCKNRTSIHARLLIDNTTAVSYICKQGGDPIQSL